MAVWQFSVALVPKRWLEAGGTVDMLLTDGIWETAPAWTGVDANVLQDRVQGILPRGKSWHSDLTLWGSDERSDIQLFLGRGGVESLRVRFDLREPDMQLFGAVVDLARTADLAILDMGRRRELRDLSELIRAAAESDAAHFVLDSASFLEQVGISARAT